MMLQRYLLFLCLLPLLLNGCTGAILSPETTGQVTTTAHPTGQLKLADVNSKRTYASAEMIRNFSAESSTQHDYRFGPGDVLDVLVWRRPELSREAILVAPDGRISLPKAGILQITGMTVSELTEQLTSFFSRYYENPDVSVVVREFHNNKAFVLGRVSNPGVVNFPGNGTLLEALAMAGGLPHGGTQATHLSRCAIIRGNDNVVWIDLRALLDGGNMALNAHIENNDVIFIPEAEDEMAMILGEVGKPGPIMIKPGLGLVDAVMQAGGYTSKADLNKVYLIRPSLGEGKVQQIALKSMLQSGNFSQNYLLEQDDIVYVSPNGMSKFNYVLEQLMPSLQIISMSAGAVNDITTLDFDFSQGTGQ